ncbi:four helix bundle protein [Chitinophaga japonensis]|uniref:Four helix bundle protein n=1 Tax=Chitinophaga japonensis TaxID=104662 RepID=A0A562TEK4_CHIJA|nr:four helix bundle protein [Chitinophaga japonensis]TWI91942.1 four helix bundle protein [Chitinophaga japonensis]
MSKIERFEDLVVWKESFELAVSIYQSLANCKDFGLKDQLCRSAVSVPSNIAEGFERNSNKEFIRFLKISKGSAGELRTQLYIAIKVGAIDLSKGQMFIKKSISISSMLQKLITTRMTKFV